MFTWDSFILITSLKLSNAGASARRLRSADTAKCVVRRMYNFDCRTTSVEHVATPVKTVQ